LFLFQLNNLFSRPEQCQFATKVLEMAALKIHEFRLSELVPYHLHLSFHSHLAPQINTKFEQIQLRGAEKQHIFQLRSNLGGRGVLSLKHTISAGTRGTEAENSRHIRVQTMNPLFITEK
jgi:hypothetical protein